MDGAAAHGPAAQGAVARPQSPDQSPPLAAHVGPISRKATTGRMIDRDHRRVAGRRIDERFLECSEANRLHVLLAAPLGPRGLLHQRPGARQRSPGLLDHEHGDIGQQRGEQREGTAGAGRNSGKESGLTLMRSSASATAATTPFALATAGLATAGLPSPPGNSIWGPIGPRSPPGPMRIWCAPRQRIVAALLAMSGTATVSPRQRSCTERTMRKAVSPSPPGEDRSRCRSSAGSRSTRSFLEHGHVRRRDLIDHDDGIGPRELLIILNECLTLVPGGVLGAEQWRLVGHQILPTTGRKLLGLPSRSRAPSRRASIALLTWSFQQGPFSFRPTRRRGSSSAGVFEASVPPHGAAHLLLPD